MDTNIAIIGAGRVGGNLGGRLADAGYRVRLGVRRPAEATELRQRFDGRAEVVDTVRAAAGADVIFLCVPAAHAVAAVLALGGVDGTILVDCTNPVDWKDGPVLASPPEGSMAQAIAAAVPDARVIKGFNTFGAEIHGDPDLGGVAADVLLAGDDGPAKQRVSEIAAAIGFAPIDAGPLRNAGLLEALAVLWIHLATSGGLDREMAFKLLRRGQLAATPPD